MALTLPSVLRASTGGFVEVTIPPGLSAKQTAFLLEKNGVIKSKLLFRVVSKFTGYDKKIKPGTYNLQRGMPLSKLLKTLKRGISTDIRVLIPEGFSAKQIAERLERKGLGKASEFLKYVRKNRLEGYLFPTTYNMDPKWPPKRIAERMRREFDKRIKKAYSEMRPRPKFTLHQVVTLASIVEREAVIKEEKPTIAAVYLNRMRIRMMLEADPTVQYALGYWKKRLLYKDLKNPSPYNTYNHYGLPPGPICSPGLDSVKGVLRPADTKALYFVADAKGGHVFTMNFKDHLKAKKKFKAELRRQKLQNRLKKHR